MKIRLNKFLAMCGVASRREADILIRSGLVEVNNKVINNPAYRVDSKTDIVKFDNRRLKIQPFAYYAFYKPKNVLTTSKRDAKNKNKAIIYDFFSPPHRVFYVGRLDYDAEGLILLTNDGRLSHKTLHPKYKVEKVYEVIVNKKITPFLIKKLEKGITSEYGKIYAKKIYFIKKKGSNYLYKVILTQGVKRQIKLLFHFAGAKVLNIKRVKFANISLGNLRAGEIRELSKREVSELLKMLKL